MTQQFGKGPFLPLITHDHYDRESLFLELDSVLFLHQRISLFPGQLDLLIFGHSDDFLIARLLGIFITMSFLLVILGTGIHIFSLKEKMNAIWQETINKILDIMDSASKGVIIFNEKGKIITINTMARKAHQYGAIPQNMEDYLQSFQLSNEEGEAISQEQFPIKRLLRGEKINNCQCHFNHGTDVSATSCIYKFEGISIQNPEHDTKYYLLLMEDITQEKKFEKEILSQKIFVETLLENIPVPIFSKNREGLYNFCNNSFVASIGITKEQLIGKTVYEIAPLKNAQIYHQKDLELMQGGPKQIYQAPMKYSDGSEHTIMFHKNVYFDYRNEIAGIVGVMMDITKNKQFEEEKKNLMNQIFHTEKLASIGTMAGNFAHEINTPLSAIMLNIEELKIIINQENISRSRKNLMDEIVGDFEKATNQMSNIVNTIRKFARSGNEKNFQNTNIIQVIYNAVDLCRKNMENHGITIHLPPDDLWVEAEIVPSQIIQVFVNLLNNSLDALMELPEKWIKISLTNQNALIEIRFVDGGHGIPHEIQNEIFNMFFTTKEEGKGTGLGLGIVHSVINAHRGRVFVDNDSPNTCFVIEIPQKHDEKIF
ncbi:MAG: PAS domain S-box protein [Oligoflexia bacterium]|nr:PAS domain S-box protein [Oligoflexia bacterium]